MLGLAAILILQQALVSPAQRPSGSAPALPSAPTQAWAVRADRAPAIDGRDDDPVWRLAPAIGPFLEWQPHRGEAVALPHRGEGRLRRRQSLRLHPRVRPASRQHHSPCSTGATRSAASDTRRLSWWTPTTTGAAASSSGVNASGVKVDVAIYDDDSEDQAWDAVWDVATRIDSLGWTAEFRVPLSQLRYPVRRNYTFGLLLMRDVYRYSERVSLAGVQPVEART